MRVKAAPGTKCPKEGKPRDYITEAEDVPESAYYKRLVNDGSLTIEPDEPEKKKKEAKSNGK